MKQQIQQKKGRNEKDNGTLCEQQEQKHHEWFKTDRPEHFGLLCFIFVCHFQGNRKQHIPVHALFVEICAEKDNS